ncbi:hypothetical protein FDR10_22125 [Salmonella enterica]|nr:hypothetical protein [Salmonella enterica]ECJ2545644.1 hypothetical protein [Salmonella enterica subsp. arizonae]EAZ5906650.1 hypothetical protein [Salmonella enterica]EBT7486348.1 hypothetical protein [Salmonella enterica]EEU6243840.1 hypothetical protein [Salmonella enterica]
MTIYYTRSYMETLQVAGMVYIINTGNGGCGLWRLV